MERDAAFHKWYAKSKDASQPSHFSMDSRLLCRLINYLLPPGVWDSVAELTLLSIMSQAPVSYFTEGGGRSSPSMSSVSRDLVAGAPWLTSIFGVVVAWVAGRTKISPEVLSYFELPPVSRAVLTITTLKDLMLGSLS
jgi:hypothetical protein